jgi:hypothetical protein
MVETQRVVRDRSCGASEFLTVLVYKHLVPQDVRLGDRKEDRLIRC